MKSLVIFTGAALSVSTTVVVACGGAAGDGLGGGGSTARDGAAADSAGQGGSALLIDAGGFSRACSNDADCVGVKTGSACALCACVDDAIAKTELAAFEAYVAELAAACPERPGIACNAGCEPATIACVSGRCAFSPDGSKPVDAGDGG